MSRFKEYNLNDILEFSYVFIKWNDLTYKGETFENRLDTFGAFSVYNDFKEFLNKNEDFRKDVTGELMDVNAILSNKHIYDSFLNSNFRLDGKQVISHENINKPFLFGEAKTVFSKQRFILVEHLKIKPNFLTFLNDVLMDIGQVIHPVGIGNKYEVQDVVIQHDY